MRITCLGAARTVTGSSYLVEMDDDACFLVDCGLFQGGRQIERRNRDTSRYRPADLRAIFITHAHIDHSGLVPRLVREGFNGPVYASEATCELLKILWLDSAHIQEMEASWQSRKNKRQGGAGLEPLYETTDADAAIRLLHPVEMDCHLGLIDGVQACFVGAGHILGAASLHLNLRDKNGGEHQVGFSGDLGRPGQLIVPDPEAMPPLDMLFMETTYGNRRHKSLQESQAELLAAVKEAYANGGKVLIPAFAVERTQEIIYTLAAAYRAGEIPDDMPIFLDSPLAIKATEIFRAHPEFFDQATTEILNSGQTPLNLPNLRFTLSTEESRAINEHKGPAVIMAGNGMASAGRIKHHLKHNLWRSNTQVVIVGFQAQGTTGRALVEGASKVKIFREDVVVRAKVHTINGFSAHADREELLAWLTERAHPGLRVYLTHGEESSALSFRDLARQHLPQVSFMVPRINDVIQISAPARGKAAAAARPAAPAARPDQTAARLRELQAALGRLADGMEAEGRPMGSQRSYELETHLAAVERILEREGAA